MTARLPAVLGQAPDFPDPRRASRAPGFDGLVAIGGDLSVDRLLAAYRSGIFPWSVNPITWWSPDPRGILDLDMFHLPRSLRRSIRGGGWEVRFDTAFRDVIEGCARQRRPGGTWISREFVEAYTRLHQAGHAHSAEAWRDGRLAGGVYGVAAGGLFAGESMFHRETDASKVALAALVERLRARGFRLFDTQMVTPVTAALGAREIAREEYLARLRAAAAAVCVF